MAFIDELESEATSQLSEIRAAREDQTSNPDRLKRAKLAIGVIGAYVRLRATMANEHGNQLIERRLVGDGQRRLSGDV